MQCHNLPSIYLTTLGVRNLLMHPIGYTIIPLFKVLHTTHAPSNVPLDISLSPVSYSLQLPFTKSYQYLIRTFLFDTIYDFLDNPKPIAFAQGSIYSRAITVYFCPVI